MQVETAFRDYGRFTDLTISLLYGGVGYGKQRDELRPVIEKEAAAYEKHLHHHGGYGRPFPGRYKDIFADKVFLKSIITDSFLEIHIIIVPPL